MSGPARDPELARQLRELRAADEASAPEFGRVWGAARARARAPRAWRPYWAGALGATAAVGLAAALLLRPAPSPDFGELELVAQNLGEWQAPLDFLLETPGSEHLGDAPRLSETLSLDGLELQLEERSES